MMALPPLAAGPQNHYPSPHQNGEDATRCRRSQAETTAEAWSKGLSLASENEFQLCHLCSDDCELAKYTYQPLGWRALSHSDQHRMPTRNSLELTKKGEATGELSGRQRKGGLYFSG